jgi:uncharacterized protein YciI
MAPYFYKLIPPRADFAFTMSDDERSTMVEHLRYWTGLANAGRALAFGPVHDPAGGYGIGIVLADDINDAERLRAADPAVRSRHGFRTCKGSATTMSPSPSQGHCPSGGFLGRDGTVPW